MFKRNRLTKLAAILLVMFVMVSMQPLTAQAAKPEKPPPTETNTAPVITQVSTNPLVVDQGTSGTINLEAKDRDRDSMSWEILVDSGPSNGTAEVSELTDKRGTSTAVVTYTNTDTDFSDTDSFVVTVSDSKGGIAEITINVTINPTLKDPVTPATINYVSLGDSIATGTLYSNTSIPSYVKYFYSYLQEQNSSTEVILEEFATDGDRTNELYSKLGLDGVGDTNLLEAVAGAEIITLSIGGNNLMQAAKDESSLGGYDFDKIDTVIAEQGLKDFQAHWVPIIQKIRSLNNSAQLIVTTTYNPYNAADVNLHNTVDSYLSRIDGSGLNDLIINNASEPELSYSVANVYQDFDAYGINNNMDAVTYFYPEPRDWWGNLTRNPHPNEQGQSIITNLCKGAYQPLN